MIINISICMYSLLGFGACVRTYQWDGVSWLVHLYHCGLGGILAGKGKERVWEIEEWVWKIESEWLG